MAMASFESVETVRAANRASRRRGTPQMCSAAALALLGPALEGVAQTGAIVLGFVAFGLAARALLAFR